MASKRKRGRKHPGVVLIKPDATHKNWRARYIDPDTEKTVKVTLDPKLSTAELRANWAADKAEEIAERRFALKNGAPRASGDLVSEAIDRYFEIATRLGPDQSLGDKTLAGYRSSAAKFKAFLKKRRIETVDQLRPAVLKAFKEELIVGPKQTNLKDGKRGAKKTTDKPRSPHSVNRDLRSVGTVLRYLRKGDGLPFIKLDDIVDCLEQIPTGRRPPPTWLSPAELNQLLAAARAHDAETHVLTREEKLGLREPGTTPKYPPIYPLVLGLMLTGMRFDEAVSLTWNRVSLEAGKIRLNPEDTKTKLPRTIDLRLCPSLVELLDAVEPKKGAVFGVTYDEAQKAGKRLQKVVPRFRWKALRSTCGSYLTNAPGIFDGASAYRSAKQLGHSVVVAEKHYVDLIMDIPSSAKTLEDAMQLRLDTPALQAEAAE